MQTYLTAHAKEIIALSYQGVFLLCLTAELLREFRPRRHSVPVRWLNNLGLGYLNSYLLSLLFPLLLVDLAVRTEANRWGLMNLLETPPLFNTLLAILLLDFIAYLGHRLMHSVKALWRLHLVHHADPEVNFTTDQRHHPGEALVTISIAAGAVIACGMPPAAVILYSVLTIAVSAFAHTNLRVPAALDRRLRYVLVTPDMHRVHHSCDIRETDSNFGIVFSWWDRWLGTYVPQPALGHRDMQLGIEGYGDDRNLFIDRLLLMPWLKPTPPGPTSHPHTPP